jgi:hypothetical protein
MRRAGGRLAAAVLVALAAAPVVGGVAGERLGTERLGVGSERLGVGSERFEWELRGLRTRVEREPRASHYELERARRELSELWVERSRDPRLTRLDEKIRDLQWRADREIDRAGPLASGAAL